MKKELLLILSILVLAGTVFGQSEDDFDITQNRGGTITITGYRGTVKDVIIPTTIEGIRVTEIGANAFMEKQLTSVTIPNGVTSIGERAFSVNQLTSVTIPNSVTSIGRRAIARNQLTSVTIPDSVTSIGEWAFYDNQITSLTIPDSVTTIGSSAFNEAFAENQVISITLGANARFSLSRSGFPNNLEAFYISQDRRAGTYTWSGRIWTVR